MNKITSDYVFHNTTLENLELIKKEGMTAGSFSNKPIKFFGDIWLAVKKSDLPKYQVHNYGNYIAYEPNYITGYDKEGFPIEKGIPFNKIVIVNSKGKAVK